MITAPGIGSCPAPASWANFPPPYRSILLGLREELESIHGVRVGPQFRNRTWEERYWYGVSVFEMSSHPEHVCNLYVYGNAITLLKPGYIRARMEGDQREFDLADPESIPQVVRAVRELLHPSSHGKG